MIDNERAVLCFSIYECRLVSGVVVVLFSPFRSDCSWLVVLLAVDLWLYCGYCQRCCTVECGRVDVKRRLKNHIGRKPTMRDGVR